MDRIIMKQVDYYTAETYSKLLYEFANSKCDWSNPLDLLNKVHKLNDKYGVEPVLAMLCDYFSTLYINMKYQENK